METTSDQRVKAIYRVTLVGTAVNVVLTIAKLLAGIFGRSSAMVADAVHSASDFATDLVVLVFVRISAKPKDEDHDYGHGKYETLATLIIGLALAAVGIGILVNAARSIAMVMNGGAIPSPEPIALIAAVVSIVAKEWLYRYTVAVGRRVQSSSVIANAWHHRSDAFSSIGTLVGIGCAYFLGGKWRIADPIAAMVVAALIVNVAYGLVRSGLEELLEKSLPLDVENDILGILTANPAVTKPHNLRTRRIGSGVAIDAHIRVDGNMTVHDAHELTVEIEKALKARFGDNTIVSLHVEPEK